MNSPVDGGALPLWWGSPFAGMLLSLAILPELAPRFWQRWFGIVAALWSAAFVWPFAMVFSVDAVGAILTDTIIAQYLPFIILLAALYIVAGGVRLTGTLHGTPGVNTLLLLIGALAANVMGTTGAAMLLVRPLIRANQRRRHGAHVFVFFTFLVANIGGALTPLGNPPLLIGFLNNVPFFWPAVHLLLPTVTSVAVLLAVFYALDRRLHRRRDNEPPAIAEIERFGIDGKRNVPLLLLIPLIVLAMGIGRSITPFWAPLVGNAALVGVAAISLTITRRATHRANHFAVAPMIEVAVIFAAIFITVSPLIEIMRAGPNGALAPALALVEGKAADAAYFWLSGLLSSLLDSAPTYLVFFNFAGGDATRLTGAAAHTLIAISAGAVFMGAATYIGNAPNLMVKAVCEERGIRMPGFFGYLAWAGAVLLPLYLLLTVLFFRP